MIPAYAWLALGAILALLLALDLFVLRRRSGESLRAAAMATAAWTAAGLLAALGVAAVDGGHGATQYLTVCLLERALSLDNVAVFAIVLATLRVAPARREGLVAAGVGIALVLRVALIGGGLALVGALHAALYAFGTLLVLTGVRTVRSGLPNTGSDTGEEGGVIVGLAAHASGRSASLLPLAVLAVADIVFAADSIPAAFGVTRDAFPIVAANGFAVLGLHAAYVLLERGLARFRHLDAGLGVVLVLIGAELLTEDLLDVPAWVTLAMVVGVLAAAVLASGRPGAIGAIEAIGGVVGSWLRRNVRKLAVSVGGAALILAGVALLVLPGPGLLVIVAGLALLATEYAWARRRLDQVRGHLVKAGAAARHRFGARP